MIRRRREIRKPLGAGMNAMMRTAARGAIWATALLVASSCLAQTSGYPNRPVKVIVPFPPGGATDVIVRLMTQKLSVSLGQPFYAENHAGAGGNYDPIRDFSPLTLTATSPYVLAVHPSLPARNVSEL